MRTKQKTYEIGYAMPGKAYNLYKDKMVKKQKTVQTRKGTKTVDYSPITYYGKQKRTVSKSWK